MTTGRYKIESKQNVVYVVLDGVFSLDNVKSYEKHLHKHIAANQQGSWFLIADVNLLQPSAMEAVKYTENITNWILKSGCEGIINIHDLNASIIDFQLAIAAGDNKVYNTKTQQQAQQLLTELVQLLDKAG